MAEIQEFLTEKGLTKHSKLTHLNGEKLDSDINRDSLIKLLTETPLPISIGFRYPTEEVNLNCNGLEIFLVL